MSESQANSPVVRVMDVHFQREGRTILAGANIDLFRGHTTAVLGRNGAGKSTLFRIIAGAWAPTGGRVELNGAPVSYSRSGRNTVRRSVQMVLQEPDDQIFSTSVRADVSFGPMNMGLDEAEVARRVDDAMARTDIAHLADHVPHHLSFGQRKRVVLAGALAMDPSVLLLDEPSAGLDPDGTRRVVEIVNSLRAAGTAVVLSTHDVNLAYLLADTVAILLDGRLIVGPPREILCNRELMAKAHLELPWAPAVSAALGRPVQRVEDLLEG